MRWRGSPSKRERCRTRRGGGRSACAKDWARSSGPPSHRRGCTAVWAKAARPRHRRAAVADRPVRVRRPSPRGRPGDLHLQACLGPLAEHAFGAYEEASTLADGWRERVDLYQLLPLLVHAGAVRRLLPRGSENGRLMSTCADRPFQESSRAEATMSTSPTEFNAKIIEQLHANEGHIGGMFEGMPLLLLHHTSASSGKSRVNPLAYQADRPAVHDHLQGASTPEHPLYATSWPIPNQVQDPDQHDQCRRRRGDRRGARAPVPHPGRACRIGRVSARRRPDG